MPEAAPTTIEPIPLPYLFGALGFLALVLVGITVQIIRENKRHDAESLPVDHDRPARLS